MWVSLNITIAYVQVGPLKSSPENVVEKRNIFAVFKLSVVLLKIVLFTCNVVKDAGSAPR